MAMAWIVGIWMIGLMSTQAAPPRAAADFSGTWTMTSLVPPPKPNTGGGSVALPPSDEVLRQTPRSLVIERTYFGEVNTQTFTLDGAENTNKSGATVLVSRTRWVGNKLITEGKKSQVTSQGYDEWTVKETRSLNAAGLMIVETEYVGLDGKVTASTRQYTRRPARGR
jgi:hypothetical protein